MPDDPRTEYQGRLDRWRATHDRLDHADRRLSYLRLGVAAAWAAAAVLIWNGPLSAWVLLVPTGAFIGLLLRHERVIRAADAARRAAAFYERGIARIEDRWVGTGDPGERFRDEHHPYANDLDLFGRGSLFELLSLARTRTGQETLASWLTHPADRAGILERQAGVVELGPALDLRERLSLAGSAVEAGVHTDQLLQWAEGPPVLNHPILRVLSVVMTLVTVGTAVSFAVTGEGTAFVSALLVQMLMVAPQRRRLDQALHAAAGPARDLDVLSHVLEQLEGAAFTSPGLAGIRRQVDADGAQPSRTIRTLHRLVEMHDWQHNIFFAPVAAILLWGTHLAWAIEGWRRRHGPRIRPWIAAVGELEAYASLSAYHYEHPGDPFPEIVPLGAGPRPHGLFEGTGLGHPLLPAARAVRNDVRLSGETQLLVVSGSNMSGKSTFLRTVGVNAVLALAGAPVRAATVTLTPLVPGATLRIQDSLLEGRSRFYAEITRVREITRLADGPVPVLFLLDELFHGTNSHDRLIGASGVLSSLLDRGAIGLITTHDLALTKVADSLGGRAVNVHFEDWFDGGEMRFDYRVRPGPVTRSNAVALMRAVGLEVGTD